MPRLFTGLEIPAELAQDLSLMRGGLTGARWIDAENYHLTLRFIGDIDDAMARDVAATLDLIRKPPLAVTLDALDSFGGDKPRSLIVKARSNPVLNELQAEQERLMRRIGLPPEPRKFTPHVTLARLRATPADAVAHYIAERGLFAARRFEARRFVLYSSRASTGGGPYRIEAAYPLGEEE